MVSMDSTQIDQTTISTSVDPIQKMLFAEIKSLREKITAAQVPPDLKAKVESMLDRLELSAKLQSYSEEYERMTHYIDWVTSLPWTKSSEDVLDLVHTKDVLDAHHYGLEQVKERILEYVSILKLKNQKRTEGQAIRAPIILLVGLVGTGKTTFAYSLAEALGRKIVRVPFGGMGSARDLRGQSRLHDEAEPGSIIKGMRQAGVNNPVMLLDEIDRVAEDARADIMGVLVELLDPEQNSSFVDHYLDYPVDLSQVLFIATANNTRNIATAVYDRLEQIDMPSYTDAEKIEIAKGYLLPRELEGAGLTIDNLVVSNDVWPAVVRPLGFDSGIRTLQRTIRNMCGKVAKEIVEKGTTKVDVTAENVKHYLPQY